MGRFCRLSTYAGLGVVFALSNHVGVCAQELRTPTILAATSNQAIREVDTAVDRLVRAGDLRVRLVQADASLPTRTHERLVQHYGGVPVYGGDIARQLDGGLTISVFGTVYGDIELDTTPTLTSGAAQAIIEGLAGAPMTPVAHPELTILPTKQDGHVLTYKGRVFTGTDLRLYFVDAHTGEVVLEFSDLLTQGTVGTGLGVLGDEKKISVTPSGGGFIASDRLRPLEVLTYDMRSDVDRVRRVLDGRTSLSQSEIAGDMDNVWDDPVEVDGHVNIG